MAVMRPGISTDSPEMFAASGNVLQTGFAAESVAADLLAEGPLTVSSSAGGPDEYTPESQSDG